MTEFLVFITFVVVFCVVCFISFFVGGGDNMGTTIIAMVIAGGVVYKIWG